MNDFVHLQPSWHSIGFPIRQEVCRNKILKKEKKKKIILQFVFKIFLFRHLRMMKILAPYLIAPHPRIKLNNYRQKCPMMNPHMGPL